MSKNVGDSGCSDKPAIQKTIHVAIHRPSSKKAKQYFSWEKPWKQVIALLKGALICWVKTILYVTWEQFAIQFLLVKSLFFDLTSHSRTWDYRSGISPAGPEKWLGPGIYVPTRKTCFSQRTKGNQRLYLAKVLMNKTLCVGRGNRVILVGQVVVDFHREQTWAIITGPALTC